MRGGDRGGGRPKGCKNKKPRVEKAVKRETVKQVRWTADEWKKIEAAAMAAGMPVSEFVRKAALARCAD
jgi:uncharacterized protein (DUF1778 family)